MRKIFRKIGWHRKRAIPMPAKLRKSDCERRCRGRMGGERTVRDESRSGLRDIPPVPHGLGVSLADHTSFRIGGPADVLLRPRDEGELSDAFAWASSRDGGAVVLGGGSNVLVSDEGLRCAVILTGGVAGVTLQCPQGAGTEIAFVYAAAGVDMDRLCDMCAAEGLSGLEPFGGLPGTVGGAVYMNARCYGRSASDALEFVKACDEMGRVSSIPADNCGFGYKRSRFQSENSCVLGARFRLERGRPPEEVARATRERRSDRREKGQFLYPNAGCVFQNDYELGVPAGRVIDSCGLKGAKVGGAEVFSGHANFIVNTGRASAEDVAALIRRVEGDVLAKSGVRLVREIRMLGRFDRQ